MKKVSITTGSNFTEVSFDNLTIWTSYRTVIAFRTPKTGKVVRENDWGPTTGKHLNAIDGGEKSSRLPGEKFEALLNDALVKLGLSN